MSSLSHSRRYFATFALLPLLVFAVGLVAESQTSTTVVPFQGRVTLSSGDPPGDALYRMRFELFDAPFDGNLLWKETNTDVPVAGGLFAAALGSISPFPADVFAGDPDLYLQVTIDLENNGFDDNDVQTPRTPLNAVPVALEAANAAKLGGRPAAEYATQVDVETGLSTEANQTEVDTALSGKAEQAAVDASQSAQDAAIALKADQSSVNTALAAKADASALFQWELVKVGPVAMEANRGYVVNAPKEVSLNLPSSGALSVGDVVRVSGIGSGGWRLEQAIRQKVLTRNLQVPNPSAAWVARENERFWSSVASSADGTRLVAAVDGGRLYTSTDAGATWTARESDRYWTGVASSADGSRLLACERNGWLYTSMDAGATWTAREIEGRWSSVASSADGTRLVAVGFQTQIHVSTDGGVSWNPREDVRFWTSVASSADGMHLFAVGFGTQIYWSADGGFLWYASENARDWLSVASSTIGNRVIALSAQLYTSTDYGVTWTARGDSGAWNRAASSADGTRLVIATSSLVYTSTDGGLTLTPQLVPSGTWTGLASSADGARLVAVSSGDQIYTYSTLVERSTTGVLGGLAGGYGTAIELQYIGGDTFLPISHEGNLSAF
ncbi:MAG: hypothetical protein RLZZ303_164 [Candidatus Hydrogenedentota bacterium]|jgi:hypothetical protein